ncbi:DUF4405 domain-containing protein [Pannonibacter sp. Pt2]|uniref:DUF4405 domain-containing protein n=1 Tax=Pannonibacter anstelovis TaxID=3121537 RepID=A0ABU7ZHC3_9HYPH
MRDLLFRWTTPLTAGLFLVSTISGVALFFGWQSGLFHEMHEVLSMVLLAPVAVHLWRNWKPMLGYFRRAAMPLALAGSLAAGGFFAAEALSGPGRSGNPAMAMVAAVQNAPLSVVAPVLGLEEAALIARLEQAGIKGAAGSDTLSGLAASRGEAPMAMMAKAVTAP